MKKLIIIIALCIAGLFVANSCYANSPSILSEEHQSKEEMQKMCRVYLYGVWLTTDNVEFPLTHDDIYIDEVISADGYGNCMFYGIDSYDFSKYFIKLYRKDNKIYMDIRGDKGIITAGAVKIEG